MSIEEREAPVVERRRAASGARASWASNAPFVPRPTVTVDMARVASDLRTAPGHACPAPSRRRRSEWEVRFVLAVVAADAVVAGSLSTATAATMRLSAPAVAMVGVLAAMLWVVMIAARGGYRSRRLGSGPEEFQSHMHAALLSIALLGLFAYTTQTLLPRRWVFITVPAIALVDAVARYIIRRVLHRARRRGRAMLRTLVVGRQVRATALTRDLAAESSHGYLLVGLCSPVADLDGSRADKDGLPVLGGVSDVPQVVHDHQVDVVIVTGAALSGPALRRLSWALESAGADLVVEPGLVEVAGPHVSLRPTAGLSLVHLETPSRHLGRHLGKAVLDRTAGVTLLACAVLPVLVCAALVRVTSPGRAFFPQTRAGRDGQPFTMWKLRSMVVDAELRRGELIGSSDRDGLMFKMHRDPRITPVGRILRRLSLDELPQLWNVVKGDMSLVGPRPPLMSEFERYHDAVNRRLRVKPGLTGLWQVSGRADLDWEQSVNLDLRYVDNWSLAMDLLILWKTLRVVVRGSGAY